MRKVLVFAACACALIAAACNTIEGVGQDVEKAGEAVARTARDAKN
jgi:predicted small secreted protein